MQGIEALGAPAQVVDFLGRGMFHLGANPGQARGCGLSRVQGLGTDLAAVVDAHQARGMAALGITECALLDGVGWRAAFDGRCRRQ